ncbi:hypothetical protein BT93_G0087 [Corymbia citriodora subsp. variegata]|nr:hypothetical protein BT93_G0087 [Corymbia citriodora subsp. variegata]
MDFGNNHPRCLSTTWPNVCSYEVFLSFRGGDVHKGFIQFLYRGLVDSGIDTFIDYDGIEFGEKIMPKILQVIRHTDICIPVFSDDFASSKSCLKEVAEMVEFNRTIMPIFYDVSPSVVGEQKGNYQKSFCTHAALGVMSATIDTWKKALHNYALIDEVVSKVRQLLRKDDLYVPANLVGMDSPVQEVMQKLDVRYENGEVIKGQILTGKRVVEISGLPGIGKSTLATVVYNKIHHLFEGKSFLKDIHEEVEQRRLLSLQEYLISCLLKKTYTPKSPAEGTEFIQRKFRDKRVLIILDDVSDFKQINSLAGDPSWFDQGSRIIVISMRSTLVNKFSQARVTCRSSSIVNSCDDFVIAEYKLNQMNDDHAFQLFCNCALIDETQVEFSSLARDIIFAAGGIPLVIEVVGLHLRGEDLDLWNEALCKLKEEPYDKKNEKAKEIFLDIACFFEGKDKTIPSYMWKACKYYPYRGIDELHNMSLVKTGENNELCMNNQLKVLGREIVKEKYPSKPFKWRRLWNPEDIEPLFNREKDAAVEALSATFDKSYSFPKRRFASNWSNLRYLKMNRAIKGSKQNATSSRKGSSLPSLKWLEWQGCNNISTLLALDLSNLVILDLSWSTSRSWQCWRRIMKKAKNLKVLILRGCCWLAESPVSHAPVERLNLEHCSISGVGRSISKLENLVSLNIRFCSFVQELPKGIGSLKVLKELYIDGTSIKAIDFPAGSYGKLEILSACKISSLSNSIGNLKSLSYLALDESELSELPDSIRSLNNLQTLSLRSCRRLRVLPDSIGHLGELQVMDLSDTLIYELPSSVKDLRNLKVLKMHHTFLREFPGGIMNLERLGEIDFSDCVNLTRECDITGLLSLRVLFLENTHYSQVIGTDGQYSYFSNLKFRISD